MHGRGAEPFHAPLHDDALDPARFVFGPHHGDVREWCIGNPHLRAVEDDIVTVFLEVGGHSTGVGTVIRLGQAEAAHHLTGRQLGQVLLLLFLCAVAPDGVHHQAALNRSRRAQTAVAAFEFLHNDAIANLVEAGATVFRWDVWPEGANLTEAWQQVSGKLAFLSRIFNDGADLLLHPLAGGFTDQLVLLGQQLVQQVVVVSLVKVRSHGSIGIALAPQRYALAPQEPCGNRRVMRCPWTRTPHPRPNCPFGTPRQPVHPPVHCWGFRRGL